jgi:hypothetical protein
VRPTGLESLRAIQAALAEEIAPELQSLFAQDAAQVLQMLTESLAAEWDTAVETMARDNEATAAILGQARDVITSAPGGNETLAGLVSDIDGVLSGRAGAESLALSSLAARNNSLRAVLERLIVALEDLSGEPGAAHLAPVRAAVYRQLREESVRGWSFFDVLSFRERIAAARREILNDGGGAIG